MSVTEPPCGACCYACTDGRVDLSAWLRLPEVIARAAVALLRTAAPDRSRSGSAAARLAILMIEGYRERISSRTAASCRFAPTCSAYALAAVETYGVLRGCLMTYRRLARCRTSVPFGTADPLPLLTGRP